MRQTWVFMPPPGATCTASRSPAGDHSTPETGSSKVVTSSGQPPAVDTVQTCGEPVTLERKATCLPSGDRLGAVELRIPISARTSRSSAACGGGVAAARTRRVNRAMAEHRTALAPGRGADFGERRVPAVGSGRRSVRARVRSQLVPVPARAPGGATEPEQRALGDERCPLGVLLDARNEHLADPRGGLAPGPGSVVR